MPTISHLRRRSRHWIFVDDFDQEGDANSDNCVCGCEDQGLSPFPLQAFPKPFTMQNESACIACQFTITHSGRA